MEQLQVRQAGHSPPLATPSPRLLPVYSRSNYRSDKLVTVPHLLLLVPASKRSTHRAITGQTSWSQSPPPLATPSHRLLPVYSLSNYRSDKLVAVPHLLRLVPASYPVYSLSNYRSDKLVAVPHLLRLVPDLLPVYSRSNYRSDKLVTVPHLLRLVPASYRSTHGAITGQTKLVAVPNLLHLVPTSYWSTHRAITGLKLSGNLT